MIFLDTETVGFHGVAVILQYAIDDGPVTVWSFWEEPFSDSIRLIESICDEEICGFNLAFDWFHLYKIYTMFRLFVDTHPELCDARPEDHINELGVLEEQARFYDIVIKPKAACDLMLLARRGPLQSLMDRDDIKIRRIPTQLATLLADELSERIKFDKIYFAKAKDPNAPRWKVYDIKRDDGTIDRDFKDIKLKFRASGGLKNLYRFAFKIEANVISFKDVEVNAKFQPSGKKKQEFGYAPFALAVAPEYLKTKRWKGAWPEKLPYQIIHWGYNKQARQYATDDVNYTRRLYKEFFNSPKAGDKDSELACMVACCRWKGYAVDLDLIAQLRAEALVRAAEIPTAPAQAKAYIMSRMDDMEKMSWKGSTDKKALSDIVDIFKFTDCPKCLAARAINDAGGDPTCGICKGKGQIPHPAGIAASKVLLARQAKKEVEIYDKLLKSKRLHASFKVIGALSSRMSGADGLNPQGIKHQFYVRRAFTLADQSQQSINRLVVSPCVKPAIMTLSAGDFKAFEVTIMVAVFDDPELNEAVRSGKKIHAMFAIHLFTGKTYQQILDSEGTDNDMYDKGKKGVFLKAYGGTAYTFHVRLQIPMGTAEKADAAFDKQYPNIGKFNIKVHNDFGSLSQVGGIGTRIEWREPKDYAESMLGFRRYFTLENRICKSLFELAQNPPAIWKTLKMKVRRRDRDQTVYGACQSALYGAAFTIVSAIERAVKNHHIQSPGAEICKETQAEIWKIQPSGVHPWYVQPMNIHDEIECPTRPGYEDQVQQATSRVVERNKSKVPLLAIDWISSVKNWAGKKRKDDTIPVEISEWIPE